MTRRKMTAALVAALVVLAAGGARPAFAHEVTYRGAVLAVEAARVQVQTLAEDGSNAAVIWFSVTADTRVQRGDTAVAFADAAVTVGERIVVIVDHDANETAAIEIRLAAR